MLISTEVDVSWNAKTKKHYVDAGYTFTKMGDRFPVLIDDLTTGSNEKVIVKCDYCGATYAVEYFRYLDGRSGEIKRDCCKKCKNIKIRETLHKKYGVFVPSDVDGAREKAQQTNLRLYGAENPFASDLVKEKIAATNVKKYGSACANRNAEIQKKRKLTCLERYGADSHMKTDQYRQMFRGENSPRWKNEKTSEGRERDRSCQEYRQWRDSVFRRDHYKCLRCGGRGDRKHGIEAHHISNYSSEIQSRFLVDNGITLCYFCHKEFHSMYGRSMNNLSQLTEFLNQGKKVC